MARVLVIDDDEAVLKVLRHALQAEGHEATTHSSADPAEQAARTRPFDCAIVDLHIGDLDGVDMMRRLKELQPALEVIVVTGDREIDAAVRAMREGAFDYLTKPLTLDRLEFAVRNAAAASARDRELRDLRAAAGARDGFDRILGRSDAMRRAVDLARRAAPSDAAVLLTGESGTGKELFARAIHAVSRRVERPFVAVNCGAIPETLAESELFGHEAGAFTGATARRDGRFAEAHGGTLFLDEIEAMPAAVQPKILRVLQEKTAQRVGGRESYPADVRVVAATNRDLEGDASFRGDVFHRVAGVSVRIPPLRERGDDLPALAEQFLRAAAEREGKAARRWSADAMALLVRHPWPGNVRELQNVATHVVLVCDGEIAEAGHLPDRLRGAETPAATTLEGSVEALERWLISDALRRARGVQAKAAELLGTTPRVIGYKVQKYGLKSE